MNAHTLRPEFVRGLGFEVIRIQPKYCTKPLFTAEIAEHAEKPTTRVCNNEKHGLGKDGFRRRSILSAFSAYSAVSLAAMCKIWVQDLGLREAPDPVILAKAQELDCVLLTNDQGFGDIRLYPPSDHKGIVVLKLADYRSTAKVHAVLKDLLSRAKDLRMALFVTDHTKWRKRTKP